MAETVWSRASADTRRIVTGALWFQIAVGVLTIAAAGATLAVGAIQKHHPVFYLLAVLALAAVPLAAIFIVWLVALVRAPFRQRDEARKEIDELTAPTRFPNLAIDVRNLREDWQDAAGNRITAPDTCRFWWPVVLTNREESGRVSLRFDVSILSPDGSGVVFPYLQTEQDDDLPLVVDAQDSRRIELSVFLNEYATPHVRTERLVSGEVRHGLNGDLLRLHVFDLISQEGIEMRLPGPHPRQEAPPPVESSAVSGD